MKIQWKFWRKEKSTLSPELEKIIQTALKENEQEEIEYLKNQQEFCQPYTCSLEFDEKMKQLFDKSEETFKKVESKKKYSFLRIPKVAVALCAVTIAVVFVGIRTEAIPFPKFTYTVRKEKGSYAYLADQEDSLKDMLEEKYEPTCIPKGYRLRDTNESRLIFRKDYVKDKNGELYVYQQFAKNAIIRADEIIRDYKEMVFNGSKYYVMDRDGVNKILWYTDGYQYTIKGNLSIKELVKIAKSLYQQ